MLFSFLIVAVFVILFIVAIFNISTHCFLNQAMWQRLFFLLGLLFLGITVVGGENSKRLDFGIYIKSITEGGPAWKDGRLKAGTVI